jgi:hypothetical protein
MVIHGNGIEQFWELFFGESYIHNCADNLHNFTNILHSFLRDASIPLLSGKYLGQYRTMLMCVLHIAPPIKP